MFITFLLFAFFFLANLENNLKLRKNLKIKNKTIFFSLSTEKKFYIFTFHRLRDTTSFFFCFILTAQIYL